MGKVTSKLQVTVPKVIADQYRIVPGDEIEWMAAGDSIRVIIDRRPKRDNDRRERLRRFDEATERQGLRQLGLLSSDGPSDRGWTRAELYDRDQPR